MKTERNILRKLPALSLFAISIIGAGQTGVRAQTADRPFGDLRVLATVPFPPGYPEGIAVNGNRVYVAGPARFGTAGEPASKVFAFDMSNGNLVNTYTIQGEDLSQDHANSCIAFDSESRLYVVNLQLGIVRIDLGSGQQEIYAPPIPNLLPCSTAPVNTACSPTFFDLPPLPNDIAFDEARNLYLTDSFQATIWRIPPGGGQPEVWFQDSRLDTPFGPNGLRLDPAGTTLYFSVTADGVGPFGNFLGGKIYTLPVVASPTGSDLQVFHQYNGEAPDGIAFGRSGRLYVALAAPFNSGVSILGPEGTEEVNCITLPAVQSFLTIRRPISRLTSTGRCSYQTMLLRPEFRQTSRCLMCSLMIRSHHS